MGACQQDFKSLSKDDTSLTMAGLAAPDSKDRSPVDLQEWGLRVLFCSAFYFLIGVSASTWGRFAAIYYNWKGLGPLQIGIIEGLMPLVKAICQPLWGVIADIMHKKKRVWMATQIISTVLLCLLGTPVIYDH
eukprot:jgi/Bigna1/125736/aug1.1_g444